MDRCLTRTRAGRIAYAYNSRNPEGHVANTMRTVEQLAAIGPKR